MYKTVQVGHHTYLVATGSLPRNPYNKEDLDFAIFILGVYSHDASQPTTLLSHSFERFSSGEYESFRKRCEIHFLPEEVADAALDLVEEWRKESTR